MEGNLGTTNVLLGIMAAVSVLEALCSREKRLAGGVDIFAEGDAPR